MKETLPTPSLDLDSAKARLRDALSYLENAVEKRLTQAATAQNQGSRAQVQQLHGENKHLREELIAVQSQVGEAQAKIATFAKLRTEANKRLEGLIQQIERGV